MIDCVPNASRERESKSFRDRRFEVLDSKSGSTLESKVSSATCDNLSNRLGVKKLLSSLQNTVFNRAEVKDEIENQVRLRTEELYRKANFDALTHLPNRRYFHEILDGLVVNYKNNAHPFALLFLDLDGFKKVNDSLGHNIGDELLRHVGARLQSSIRHGDIVSRLGGDEFVVLLADTPDKETIEMICKRIIKEVSRGYCFGGVEVKTSTSIGVARFPEDANTASELIQHADEALYVSKANGRRTYRFFGDVNQYVPANRYVLQAKFDDAVSQGKIEILASPVMDLSADKLAGAELKLVWLKSGLVSDEFADWSSYLLKSGWDYSVALWLVDSACYYLQNWQQERQDLFVSFPVLESLWRSEGFVALMIGRLKRYGVSADKLNLMFSLNELVTYDAFFGQVLQRLKAVGFKVTLMELGEVALDTHLISNLEVDHFQMSREWMVKQLAQPNQIKWVEGLIHFSNAVGAKVFIPGQTEKHEINLLQSMGAYYSEGSYWAPQVPIADFSQWLTDLVVEAA